MWEVMWKSFLDSPLIGHGFFVSSASGSLYVWYVDGNWTAHNVVLQALVTTGIVGASLLAYGLWRSFGPFLLSYRSTIEGRCICLLLLYYSVWAMFNESFLGPVQPESALFFTLIGIAVGSVVQNNQIRRLENSKESLQRTTPATS
jgi:O-antigen ligase